MKYKFGFIGCGNMGSALAMGVAATCPPTEIALCDTDIDKAKELSMRTGAVLVTLSELSRECEYIFLAVKPQGLEALMSTLCPLLDGREKPPVFISMAAGTPLDKLVSLMGRSYPIIRIMPNTPVAVGCGVTLYFANSLVTDDEREVFLSAMKNTGTLIKVSEESFDSESIITGCGPAYVFAFIEAMARAAEALGVSPKSAAVYAKQTVLGAAMLACNSTDTPTELCAKVCSPGGSTIEGIKLMEREGFEKIVVDAAAASFARTLEMKKL